MNIIDAIKSGKKFRRLGDVSWLGPYSDFYNAVILGFSKRDILADDWELEEKKVEITFEQLKEAFERASQPPPQYYSPLGIPFSSVEVVAKELGLLDD